MNEQLIARFQLTQAAEDHVRTVLAACLRPELPLDRYLNTVLEDLSLDVVQDYPYYEVSKFDTTNGRPAVIALSEHHYSIVFDDE